MSCEGSKSRGRKRRASRRVLCPHCESQKMGWYSNHWEISTQVRQENRFIKRHELSWSITLAALAQSIAGVGSRGGHLNEHDWRNISPFHSSTQLHAEWYAHSCATASQ